MTTDTQDADGEVLTECEVTCSEDEIRQAIMSFVGEIEQIPPMYSAIKQNGKKLYELARKGIEVERKSRKVTINSIDILEINGERVTIDVSCSKGTYIRTLCEDIGMKLHVGAYMNTLRRTKTGPFTIEESHTLKEIETLKNNGELEKIIIPVDRMFEEYPKIKLNPKQVKSVTNGVQMTYSGKEGQSYRVYDEKNKFYSRAFKRIEKKRWFYPKRIWRKGRMYNGFNFSLREWFQSATNTDAYKNGRNM